MTQVLIALVVFILAFAAMAVGVILGDRRIQGSCGGLASREGDSDCELCGGLPSDCPDVDESESTGPAPAGSAPAGPARAGEAIANAER